MRPLDIAEAFLNASKYLVVVLSVSRTVISPSLGRFSFWFAFISNKVEGTWLLSRNFLKFHESGEPE